VSVLVQDERGRPVEGAVAWISGNKDTSPLPDEPVVLSQKGLEFRPSLLVLRRGQSLEMRNDDPELHNVHGNGACCSFNLSVAAGTARKQVMNDAGEAMLLCDIHAHMSATIVVLDDAFALSDASGHASLAAVPPGKRKLHVRGHHRVKVDLEVEVAPAASASVTAVLAAEKPGPSVVPPEKLPWPTLAVRLRASLDEAVRWAAAGDATSAREAAEEADGVWYAGSGLKVAIRDFDADAGGAHADRWQMISSQIRRVATKSAAAAQMQGEERTKALADLALLVENIGNWVSDPADKLPKREAEK
jgi:plastocyanin